MTDRIWRLVVGEDDAFITQDSCNGLGYTELTPEQVAWCRKVFPEFPKIETSALDMLVGLGNSCFNNGHACGMCL